MKPKFKIHVMEVVVGLHVSWSVVVGMCSSRRWLVQLQKCGNC